MPKKPTWKSDEARDETDALLDDLEKRIKKEYEQAYEEIKAKADNYFQKFAEADAEKLAQLKANEITEQQYAQWRASRMLTDKRYKDLLEELSRDCVNADKLAMQMVNDMLPDVFALNANYAAFQIEHDTGIDTAFSLYDKKAASLLMKSNPDLLPIKSTLKIAEDLRWNKRKLDSAILQGVLQGSSIPDIAERLQDVIGMDSNSAIRNARTMTTSAENAGRYDSYEHAADAGIPVKVMWMATPDDRTRESHREIDGEEIEMGGTFSNGCRYPGDPNGEPEEVYNCRCRLQRIVPGSFFSSKFHEERRNTTIEGMSYEQWKNAHNEPEKVQAEKSKVLQALESYNIQYNEVAKLKNELTEDEIIEKIGGGDLTKGSCSSLCFTYAGNQAGYDVVDFRGGESLSYFSKTGNIHAIASLPNVESYFAKNTNDFKAVSEVIKNMTMNKEYILATGNHAAIIKKLENGFQYLELQSAKSNGFKQLTNEVLRYRFNCKKTHTIYGSKVEWETILIDTESLNKNPEFQTILGYLNTNVDKQMKGVLGFAK